MLKPPRSPWNRPGINGLNGWIAAFFGLFAVFVAGQLIDTTGRRPVLIAFLSSNIVVKALLFVSCFVPYNVFVVPWTSAPDLWPFLWRMIMGKLRLSFKFGGNLLSELWRELPDGIELSGKGKKEAAMLMTYSAMTKRGPIQPRVYQNHCKNLLAMLLTMIRSTGYRAF